MKRPSGRDTRSAAPADFMAWSRARTIGRPLAHIAARASTEVGARKAQGELRRA